MHYLSSDGGSNDIYLTKVNASGVLLRTATIGGRGDERSYSITRDHQDNIYVAGSYSAKVDFDPGTGQHFLEPDKKNVTQGFICKLKLIIIEFLPS